MAMAIILFVLGRRIAEEKGNGQDFRLRAQYSPNDAAWQNAHRARRR